MNPKSKQYLPLVSLLTGFLIIYVFLIPSSYTFNADGYKIRATIGAFIFGSLVGVAEIASRYRDEPLKALRSPYGLIYIVVNGYLSLLASFLIYHFGGQYFRGVAGDSLLVAIVAGFGATAVMRTRIAVIKSPEGKDISIGPDFVIGILLQVIDTNIDRWRAVRRQHILSQNFNQIRGLGDFPTAWKYLLASLLAFQNLDDARKKTLSDTYNDYQAQGEKLPEDLKRLGLGFLFLTLVGESNFKSVLDSAAKLSKEAASAKPTPTLTQLPLSSKPPATPGKAGTITPKQTPATTPTATTTPPSPSQPAASTAVRPATPAKPTSESEAVEKAKPSQPAASAPPKETQTQPSTPSDSAASKSSSSAAKTPTAPAADKTPASTPEKPNE